MYSRSSQSVRCMNENLLVVCLECILYGLKVNKIQRKLFTKGCVMYMYVTNR